MWRRTRTGPDEGPEGKKRGKYEKKTELESRGVSGTAKDPVEGIWKASGCLHCFRRRNKPPHHLTPRRRNDEGSLFPCTHNRFSLNPGCSSPGSVVVFTTVDRENYPRLSGVVSEE